MKQKSSLVEDVVRHPVGILVMGMHRSGTSVLARLLHSRGAALSRYLLGANESNPTGHWESAVAIEINEKLLSDLGYQWDDMRPLPDGWATSAAATEARERIKILISEDFPHAPLWVIKEPRLCRLGQVWIEAIRELGHEVRVVIPVRPPVEVAMSLLRRSRSPLSRGFLLWMRHVAEAERVSRDVPRAIVTHEELVTDWASATDRLANTLDIQWPVDRASAERDLAGFVDDQHVHTRPETHQGEPITVPPHAAALYGSLIATRDDPAAWADVIHAVDDFERADALFGPALNLLHDAIAASEHRAVELSSMVAASNTALPDLLRSHEEMRAEFRAQQAVFAQLGSKSELVGEKVAVLGESIVDQSGQLAQIETQNRQLLLERESLQAVLAGIEARLVAMDSERAAMALDLADGRSLQVGLLEERAALQAELAHVEVDAAGLRAERDQLRADIVASRELAAEQSRRLSDAAMLLQQRAAALSAQEQALATCAEASARESAGLREEIAALQSKIVEATSTFGSFETKVSELQGIIARLRNRLSDEEGIQRQQARQLEELQRNKSELEGKLGSLRSAHERILHSRSWKITAPLRSMARAFRA